MKARLVFVHNSYHLLLCTGTIKKLTPAEAMAFLRTYDSEMHYFSKKRFAFPEGFTMNDYGGETVAKVLNDGKLVIESPEQFRTLLLTDDIKYLTPKEYAELYNKERCIITRYCREGKIAGVKKRGRDWLIPENAAYPEDSRRRNS